MKKAGFYDKTLLPVAGFLAGVLQCILPSVGVFKIVGRDLFMFTGTFFGVAIAVYFWLFRGLRSVAEPLVFIAISTGAFIVSMFTPIYLFVPLPFLDWPGAGPGHIDTSALFRAGFVGAAILFAGFYFCFARDANKRQFLVTASCFCVLGGILGMVGWLLGRPLLGSFLNCGPGDDCNFYSMFVIWQTGVACLLGFLPQGKGTAVQIYAAPGIPFPRRISISRRRRAIPGMAILFTAIVLLGYMEARQNAARAIQRREDAGARWERHWEMEGRPPTGRGTVEGPLPLEQVFILNPVGGYTFDHFLDWGTKSKPPYPGEEISAPFISYRARFMRPNAIHPEEMDLVDVTVITYSDGASARYALEHHSDLDAPDRESHFTRNTRKYGNNIEVETTLRGLSGSPFDIAKQYGKDVPLESIAEDPRVIQDVYVRWTCDYTYVRLRFYGPEDDEFLRQYLAKYPSIP
jgi:hypothetical protein